MGIWNCKNQTSTDLKSIDTFNGVRKSAVAQHELGLVPVEVPLEVLLENWVYWVEGGQGNGLVEYAKVYSTASCQWEWLRLFQTQDNPMVGLGR